MSTIPESEALKLWCPFAITPVNIYGNPSNHDTAYQVTGGAAVNRILDPSTGKPAIAEACYCIGSKCMAWRTERPVNPLDEFAERHGSCGLVRVAR